MTDKDINIHIRGKGIDQTQREIDGLAKSTQQFGETTEKAGQQAGSSTEQAGQKMSGLKGIMSGVTAAVGGFLAAWKGASWLLEFLDKLAAKYERIRNLQKDIHEQARTLQESGQALENQTGTVGKQSDWAEFLVKLRTAGAMKSTGEAETAAISFDIATGKTGGLSSQANKDLLMQLSPMFGMAQLNGDEIKKFLDLSTTAGVGQSEQDYKQFFAELYAGYRSSKSSNFGQFLTGMQSGTTGIIAQGGSSQGAVSLFSSALSVMKNEETAATLTQQIGTLSSGAYAKPRQALEAFSGQSWEQLNPDDQISILLAYTQAIPANERVQRLTEQGFSPELATGLAKMTSGEAMQVYQSTRQAVGGADVGLIDSKITAYKNSLPGRSNIRGGQQEGSALSLEKQIGHFQERLADARTTVDALAARGEDNIWLDDEREAYQLSYRQMRDELHSTMRQLDAVGTPEAEKLYAEAAQLEMQLLESGGQLLPLPGLSDTAPMRFRAERAMRNGVGLETQLGSLQQQSTTVIHNYNNNIVYNHPSEQARARTTPEDLE